jgi:hypothetical protein
MDVKMNDLFVRLSKYKPSEDRISLENFLTELVAYVIREEPAALREFLALISEDLPASEAWKIETQQSVSGFFIDLLLRTKTHFLIVENKVDSDLGKEQLNNYLQVSRDHPGGRVAVFAKTLQREAFQCGDPLFLRQVLWSDLAERWRKLKALNDRRLMDNVLKFMEANNMGPWDPFQPAEIESPEHFRNLEAKLQSLTGEIDRQVVADPFASVPNVTRRPPPFTTIRSGYQGIGWAPKGENPASASYWYFLGFNYGRQPAWAIETQNEGEAEVLVFAAMWPGREKLEGLREVVRKTCGSLLAAGFELQHSKDMRGLAIIRRRSLRDFLHEADQRKAVVNFILESHRLVLNSDALPSIYDSFVTILGNERPN